MDPTAFDWSQYGMAGMFIGYLVFRDLTVNKRMMQILSKIELMLEWHVEMARNRK